MYCSYTILVKRCLDVTLIGWKFSLGYKSSPVNYLNLIPKFLSLVLICITTIINPFLCPGLSLYFALNVDFLTFVSQ